MLLNDRQRKRFKKLGLCYFADGDADGGGVGGATPPPQDPPETKFSQADMDKIAQKVRAEEKAKFEKTLADKEAEAIKQAELAQMSEIDRLKAEKEEAENKYKAEADKNALAIQRDETRKIMSEKGLPDCFLDSVLVAKDMEATRANVDKFKATYDESVKKAVEEKIPNHVPKNNDGKETTEKTLQGAIAAGLQAQLKT